MADSEKDKKPGASHAEGSQPSVRPGSDQPQTITGPTPPVAQTTGPPTPDELADDDTDAESSRPDGERGTRD
ncbi:hypothetical protein KUM39_03065 [Streptomyces sp. J2-1]|uniref:hypothetical protein n=1 Tax=Streptomyces corallincola TaxID=2851888 RepID=UPI001C38BBE8|nr:hypothetical protein [Streptomyces corallincola]MBV2353350.1 hypothetical protein [Streptomyces corallincola]